MSLDGTEFTPHLKKGLPQLLEICWESPEETEIFRLSYMLSTLLYNFMGNKKQENFPNCFECSEKIIEVYLEHCKSNFKKTNLREFKPNQIEFEAFYLTMVNIDIFRQSMLPIINKFPEIKSEYEKNGLTRDVCWMLNYRLERFKEENFVKLAVIVNDILIEFANKKGWGFKDSNYVKGEMGIANISNSWYSVGTLNKLLNASNK